MIFGALVASGASQSALAVPELAVGWLAMRTTVRLRMPLNIAVAAPLSRLVPALSSLKISPLLASFAADEDAKAKMQAAWDRFQQSPQHSERTKQLLQRAFDGTARLVRWAEGPIDKYGLSYFLVSKVSNVTTLALATAAAAHGLDLPGVLSSWGLSNEVQGDSGLLACTAALNVAFTPLHFYGAVKSVIAMEGIASNLWRDRHEELAQKCERLGQEALTEDELDQLDLTEAQMRTIVVGAATFVVVALDLGVAFIIMRRMYGKQAKGGAASAAADPDSNLEGSQSTEGDVPAAAAAAE